MASKNVQFNNALISRLLKLGQSLSDTVIFKRLFIVIFINHLLLRKPMKRKKKERAKRFKTQARFRRRTFHKPKITGIKAEWQTQII